MCGLTGYPSIDKPWLKYYTMEDISIPIPKCTIYQNIYDRNKDYPDDIAILYYGNKIRYKTLFIEIEKCAKALRQIGIGPGDCVTFCTAGIPEVIYMVLACSRIGAIACFINPLFTREQMIARINETESKWCFILDVMYSYIELSLSQTCVENVVIIPITNSMPSLLANIIRTKRKTKKNHNIETGKKYISWKDFCLLSMDYVGMLDTQYLPDNPTVMVYSSGSTGASKGILLTNDGINATISKYDISRMNLTRGDSFLQMIPIWFSTGIVYSILMPLAKGFMVIPEPMFSKESFLKDLCRYKPAITLTATSLWLYVVNSGKKLNMKNMKYPITGGEKILYKDETSINDWLKKRGCKGKLLKGYGMCELGSEITGFWHAPEVSKPGSCGYPIPKATVAAFDIDSGKELTYGQHGEIRVLSPARMKGYYKNPSATKSFFRKDANGNIWGCTGDIGYIDEDGEVFVLGRATDSFRRENGETVYLFDIEDEILNESSVKQCKVVDTIRDNEKILVAHIVLKAGVTEAHSIIEGIDKQIRKKLPEYMIPNSYKIRQSMPVHTNGKRDIEALKNDLTDLIEIDKTQ